MSAFLNFTPTIQVVLGNPFSRTTYPAGADVTAVIDTGYEGFSAVPMDVFKQLKLDALKSQTRTLVLANGVTLNSKGAYATLSISHVRLKLNGFVETYDGLEEIIMGVQALSRCKLILDYCSMKIRLEPCP